MIGFKQRMPKWARYPLFLAGLAVIIFGTIGARAAGADASTLGAISAVGFLLLLLSVAVK